MSCKRRPPSPVVDVAGTGDAEMTETDKFLSHAGETRFVHVKPANVECNVYEEVGGTGGSRAGGGGKRSQRSPNTTSDLRPPTYGELQCPVIYLYVADVNI